MTVGQTLSTARNSWRRDSAEERDLEGLINDTYSQILTGSRNGVDIQVPISARILIFIISISRRQWTHCCGKLYEERRRNETWLIIDQILWGKLGDLSKISKHSQFPTAHLSDTDFSVNRMYDVS